jgi:hypothetical protein
MKIAIVCLVGIILLAIIALIFIGAKSKLRLDIGQTIMAISTIALVIVTVVYVGHTHSMVKAMRQSNQLNFRPYVMVDELPPNIASSVHGSTIIRPSFLLMTDNTGEETFHYYLKNIGNVHADMVELTQYEVCELQPNVDDVIRIQVPHRPSPPIPIFPNQGLQKLFHLGQNIVFRENPQGNKVRLSVHFTYGGIKELDSNRYYTEYSWVFTCAISPNDPKHRIEFGGIDVGIEEL